MKTTKPKWAKPLNKKQWQHLKECQQQSRPSLRAFKSNRKHQKQNGFECLDCISIETTLFLANKTLAEKAAA